MKNEVDRINNYDCTEDVLKHRALVGKYMSVVGAELIRRSAMHDNSKLLSPEKLVFDEFTPKLQTLTYGSDEYRQALVDMGSGLRAHYQANDHHPEHYHDGINGMTLLALAEMVCDWMAASEAKGTVVNVDTQSKRFEITAQLKSIIVNTVKWLEVAHE